MLQAIWKIKLFYIQTFKYSLNTVNFLFVLFCTLMNKHFSQFKLCCAWCYMHIMKKGSSLKGCVAHDFHPAKICSEG